MFDTVDQLQAQARLIRFDEQAVPGARWRDLDEDLWRRFLGDEVGDEGTTLRKLRILTEDATSRVSLENGNRWCRIRRNPIVQAIDNPS